MAVVLSSLYHRKMSAAGKLFFSSVHVSVWECVCVNCTEPYCWNAKVKTEHLTTTRLRARCSRKVGFWAKICPAEHDRHVRVLKEGRWTSAGNCIKNSNYILLHNSIHPQGNPVLQMIKFLASLGPTGRRRGKEKHAREDMSCVSMSEGPKLFGNVLRVGFFFWKGISQRCCNECKYWVMSNWC